jgi:hypothetical protein
MKAMAHDRNARYPTARELLTALSSLSAGARGVVRSDRPPSSAHGAGGPSLVFPSATLSSSEFSIAESAVPSVMIGSGAVPGLKRQRLVRGGVAAGALGLLAWAVAAFTTTEGPQKVSPPSVASNQPAQAPAAVPDVVTVELVGVPHDATVELDGRASGPRFELPRGATTHTVRVSADGHEPWSHELDANTSSRIEVRLTPLVASPRVAPQPPDKATSPAKSSGRAKRAKHDKPRVITELDY